MISTKPRILCVDDEPLVLDGLRLTLGRKFAVESATSGAQGLELIRAAAANPFTVIISDMRMPGMNGAELLSQARQLAPDTIRVLLTGQADLESAMAAVNEGQIFRFLTKPCPAPSLLQVMETATKQYELVHAERELLEQTLRGAINMLSDVLAMVSPKAFGQAASIREHASALAAKLGAENRWAIEIAAVLSQVSVMTLPERTMEKVYAGEPLSPEEKQMVGQLPRITDQLLANIPRLDLIRDMLRAIDRRFDEPPAKKPEPHLQGARILRVAIDFDQLEGRNMSLQLALETMRGRAGLYDPRIIDELFKMHGGAAPSTQSQIVELPLARLRQGMVLADHVRTRTGNILCAPGNVLSPQLLERLRNFAKSTGVREPIRVVVKSAADAEVARAS